MNPHSLSKGRGRGCFKGVIHLRMIRASIILQASGLGCSKPDMKIVVD